MDRDDFLARACLAAEVGRAYRVHLKPVPDNVAYLGVAGDLCQRFAAEVNEVGGQALVVADLDAARAALANLLQEAGAASAICWRNELLDRLDLAGLLQSRGIAHHHAGNLAELPHGEQRRTLLACDVGITSCDCAIAETGTLMVCSRPGQERVASLLPPLYISIVERQQIVPDLIDAVRMLAEAGVRESGIGNREVEAREGEAPAEPSGSNSAFRTPRSPLPSNVTFITGPSKTGDIELQLTTGVHGPGKWHVIVIR